jgi:hypothetical protein
MSVSRITAGASPSVAVVVIAKLSSERCRYKMLRPVGTRPLIAHAAAKAAACTWAAERILHTADPELAAYADGAVLVHLPRRVESAVALDFGGIWGDAAAYCAGRGHDLVVWLNACCPFLRPESLYRAACRWSEGRVVLPVVVAEAPLWGAGGAPIGCRVAPGTQAAAKAMRLSHAFWVRSPAQMLAAADPAEYARQHEAPAFYADLGQIEALDVDTEEDLAIVDAVARVLIPRVDDHLVALQAVERPGVPRVDAPDDGAEMGGDLVGRDAAVAHPGLDQAGAE